PAAGAGDRPRWRLEHRRPCPAGGGGATGVAASGVPGAVRRRGTAGRRAAGRHVAAPAPARTWLLPPDPPARGTPEAGGVGIGRAVLGLRPGPWAAALAARRRFERRRTRGRDAHVDARRARHPSGRPAAGPRAPARAPPGRTGAVPVRAPGAAARRRLDLGPRAWPRGGAQRGRAGPARGRHGP